MKTLLSALFTAVVALNLRAANVTLAWDANPEPDVAGYELYYGTATGTYAQVVAVAGRNTASVTVTNLVLGTYFFAVTAVSSNGLSSLFSNEVSWTNRPAAPRNLRITVQLQQA